MRNSIPILLLLILIVSFHVLPSNAQQVNTSKTVLHKGEIEFKDLPKEVQERIKKTPSYGPENTDALKNIDMKKIKELPKHSSIGSDGSIVTDLPKPKVSEKNGFLGSDNEKMDTKNLLNSLVPNNLEITHHTTYPYNAVARLLVEKTPGNYNWCSGFYIDRNTIITAAHCVYNTTTNTPAVNIEYERSPGPTGNPLYEFGATKKFWINSGYVDLPNENGNISDSKYDFAAVQVGKDSANWFGIRNSNHQPGEQILLTGYPSGGEYDASIQYKSLGVISSIENYNGILQTTGYMHDGMSGGPSWNTKVGTTAVIGINSASLSDYSYSFSTRIEGSTYDRIIYWRDLPD
ncbi:trypsin-like serine peptidase [Seinonella peptonophila]|nr:serine protease [Seinonella peptonophila]